MGGRICGLPYKIGVDWLKVVIQMISVRNFSTSEVVCRHCGKENMADSTMLKAQAARDHAGRPIYVSSGSRCPVYNAAVGGKPDSSHIFTPTKESHALDFTLVNPSAPRKMTSRELFILFEALKEAGFERLGVSEWFIHADDDPEKPERCLWLY